MTKTERIEHIFLQSHLCMTHLDFNCSTVHTSQKRFYHSTFIWWTGDDQPMLKQKVICWKTAQIQPTPWSYWSKNTLLHDQLRLEKENRTKESKGNKYKNKNCAVNIPTTSLSRNLNSDRTLRRILSWVAICQTCCVCRSPVGSLTFAFLAQTQLLSVHYINSISSPTVQPLV